MSDFPAPVFQSSVPPPKLPAWRWIFPLGWFGIVLLPGWVFFDERGGLKFLEGLEPTDMAAAIFPLLGLYALTLVWTQVILGSLMPLWEKIFPKMFVFHRAEGIFALLFATLHPTLLAVGVGLETYWARSFVAPEQHVFIYLGYGALMTIYLTVATALLMRKKMISRWWRKIHVLNYLVFSAAWVHSWNLGSDTQSTNLKYLWIGFGLTVLLAVILRVTKVGRYTARAI